MQPEFTSHNIRLDDGSMTKPEVGETIDLHPWFISSRRLLEALFPGNKSQYRIADLGCLEGGYAVEFARMGFQTLGVEVRESNIEACNFVKSRTNLPNLSFAKDNVLNIAAYGSFDAIFCCGLFYHLDKPRAFLDMLSSVTKRALILQTHFAIADDATNLDASSGLLSCFLGKKPETSKRGSKFNLSDIELNEGLPGRWYIEFEDEDSFSNREQGRWCSWDNKRSFWIQREYLIQAIYKSGFALVVEEFDNLGPNIADNMTRGYYHTDCRGTFVGLKTAN
jgi:SAM-dependent methyltransferase